MLRLSGKLPTFSNMGYFPAIEFDETSNPETYYWTMWKLPLFNATSYLRKC
jgi:ribulose bisphosphate carboxylase small subunit